MARGFANYISSFGFRQEWSQGYADLVGSEIHSVGSIDKNWPNYTFDVTFARLQNFESVEVPYTNPATGKTSQLPNAVTIRKLPEAEFTGRDRQIWNGVPLWFSFESSAGLLFRSEPIFNGNTQIDKIQTAQFTPRLNLAPHLTSVLHLGDFHLVPSIGIDETFYGESQGPDPANPGLDRVLGTNLLRSARDFSLDLIFPSLARVFDKKTIFGDKLKHVIEPRATYRYVTGIGNDFDRFIRFDETDLLSNTNELALSLANRIYAKRGDSVREIFTWELMQKRYFDPTFGGALVAGDAQRVRCHRGCHGLRVPGGAAQHIAGGVAGARQPGERPGSSMAGRLRSAQSRDRGQRLFHGLSLEEVLHAGGEQRGAQQRPRTHPRPTSSTSASASATPTAKAGMPASMRFTITAQAVVQFSTTQVTYNTDCCGISVQYRRFNFGVRDETQFRFAFAIGNVGTLGSLRKQDRLF